MSSFDKSKVNAILFDSTRCIGCRSCEEACDEINDPGKRKWSRKVDGDFRPPPDGLSSDKWLHMTFHPLPLENEGKRMDFNWDDAPELAERKQYVFARHACMHCQEPACQSVCIVGALKNQKNGAVTYDSSKCIGCRYCMVACPFKVPKYEWQKQLSYIRKCTMCENRQTKGASPYCVENCPGKDDGPALIFGRRKVLLYEAHKRIHQNKNRYFENVFGEWELGGTSVLYLMAKKTPPSQIDLPGNLEKRAMPDYSAGPLATVPYWAGGLSGMCSCLYWVI